MPSTLLHVNKFYLITDLGITDLFIPTVIENNMELLQQEKSLWCWYQ